jgi:alanine dehydrogenase
MLVGVPKEIKDHEYRVGLTPQSVTELVRSGHKVIIERSAGDGAGFSDADYSASGAQVVAGADRLYGEAELIVKVKEPQPEECRLLRPGQILFTFLHLAPDPDQAIALMSAGVTGIAYETVTDDTGKLPILTPMSEVAGRMAIQIAAHYLEKAQGGRGTLLSGTPGVPPANVAILGAGVSGRNALQMASAIGARVTILNRSLPALRDIDVLFPGRIITRIANASAIAEAVADADVVVGAVLVAGARAPKLVTREMVHSMKKGAVIVDISIDQGGCVETSRPTTHSAPIFRVDNVIHYCVTNIPGAVPRTSTIALNNATLPFVLALANRGAERAFRENRHLAAGLNTYRGHIVHEAVARALDMPLEQPQFQ